VGPIVNVYDWAKIMNHVAIGTMDLMRIAATAGKIVDPSMTLEQLMKKYNKNELEARKLMAEAQVFCAQTYRGLTTKAVRAVQAGKCLRPTCPLVGLPDDQNEAAFADWSERCVGTSADNPDDNAHLQATKGNYCSVACKMTHRNMMMVLDGRTSLPTGSARLMTSMQLLEHNQDPLQVARRWP
jgi:hypothetical protein